MGRNLEGFGDTVGTFVLDGDLAAVTFLANADLTGFAGSAGFLFFLGTLPAEGTFVCAGRLIGSGVARGGFTAGFEGVRFVLRAAALPAREERSFREVERTREAALFLPALAVRNLPFFIAIVSPADDDSGTEHYGWMRGFATEFPNTEFCGRLGDRMRI